MSSYVVCQVRSVQMGPEVVEYLQRIDETVSAHGGRFLVQGGPVDLREGSWEGDVVIFEFPDRQAATGWYDSAEYQAIAPLRQNNTDCSLFIVDGVPEGHHASDILQLG